MTYGNQIATIIITANKLGGNFSYAAECENILQARIIYPWLLGYIEKEAQKAMQWLRNCNLITAAHQLVAQEEEAL